MQDPTGGKVASMHFKLLLFLGLGYFKKNWLRCSCFIFGIRLSLFFDVVFFGGNVRL